MKKITLILWLWILVYPVLSQDAVTISGTVNDSTGMPVVNHAVIIQSDSTNGLYYYNVVYTNPNGWYIDYMPTNPAIPAGIVTVSTYDCMQNYLSYTHSYTGINASITQNFIICGSSSACLADFSYVNYSPLIVQFTDQSTGGNSVPRYWTFGDGTTSNELNPIHTYPAPGA